MTLSMAASATIAAVLAAAALVSCAGDPEKVRPAEASAGEKGSEELYALPGLDHGLIQSPVNILMSKTRKGQHKIVFDTDHAEALDRAKIEHSVRLDFTPGATISSGGKTYDFLQCHFHTPSEHQINGVTYPMELHCVNKLQGGQDPPEYLVVAFLFEMGTENPFVAKFLDRVPETVEGGAGRTQGVGATTPFHVSDLAEQIREDDLYYFYRGSLTTPPFTETVTWHVLSRIFQAAPAQIQLINRLEGNNARRVHVIHNRVVWAGQ